METKFISEFGVQDLSNVNFTIEESNSRVSDKMFTKFTLPFDFIADEEYIRMFGDYISNESNNLKNKIPGFLQIDNRLHEAVKFIQGGQGFRVTEQIDFGLEDIPNFKKKLADLPLESFTVPDIHLYAKEIAGKTWPETNFNFPRVYSKKYAPDQEMWNAYDGYYNDLKTDGTEMRRNYTDSTGNIFNINIIHPMPHIIYLLEKGFEDAGYQLEGDILTDPVLQKKWVFSGTEYFTKINQFSNEKVIRSNEASSSEWEYNPVAGSYLQSRYETQEAMPFQDKVYVNGFFRAKVNPGTVLKFKICLNGNEIWSHEETFYSVGDVKKPFSLEINVNNANISFFVEGSLYSLNESYEVISYELKSNSIINTTNETQNYDNSMVNNENKVDLKKAVPEMTFGELFNIIKNWFNYDLDIIEKRAIMNRIAAVEIEDVRDLEEFEVPSPKRTFLNDRSFLLKFSELDGDNKKDSLFYDSAGSLLNGAENDETNVIEINGYVMPVKLPKENGHNTAIVQKDSTNTLALVDYDGLKNGQNNANAASDCDFPALFETHWKPFLRLRLNPQEFNWRSILNAEYFSNFNIKNYIYAYNNVHIIKSWSKEKISENIYGVEFFTETIS